MTNTTRRRSTPETPESTTHGGATQTRRGTRSTRTAAQVALRLIVAQRTTEARVRGRAAAAAVAAHPRTLETLPCPGGPTLSRGHREGTPRASLPTLPRMPRLSMTRDVQAPDAGAGGATTAAVTMRRVRRSRRPTRRRTQAGVTMATAASRTVEGDQRGARGIAKRAIHRAAAATQRMENGSARRVRQGRRDGDVQNTTGDGATPTHRSGSGGKNREERHRTTGGRTTPSTTMGRIASIITGADTTTTITTAHASLPQAVLRPARRRTLLRQAQSPGSGSLGSGSLGIAIGSLGTGTPQPHPRQGLLQLRRQQASLARRAVGTDSWVAVERAGRRRRTRRRGARAALPYCMRSCDVQIAHLHRWSVIYC